MAEHRDVSEQLGKVAADAMDRAGRLLVADEDGPEEVELERVLERLSQLLAPGAALEAIRFDDAAFEDAVGQWMDDYEESLEPGQAPSNPEEEAELAESMLQDVLPQLATGAEKLRLSHAFAKAVLENELDDDDRTVIAAAYLTIDVEIPAGASLGLREVYFAQLDDWAEVGEADGPDADED